MTRLLVPLKYYDEGGLIKPHWLFFVLLAYLLRALFILVVALSYRQDPSALLQIIYPDPRYLSVSLLSGIPAVVCLLVVSFRHKLMSKQIQWPFRLVKPLLILALIADVAIHCFYGLIQNWQFSWLLGISFLGGCSALVYALRSKHLTHMLNDWQKKV